MSKAPKQKQSNSHEKKPLVSIIIPSYNTEKFIKRCLESIAKQTYKSLEVIIVDDGTKDNSNNIIQEFVDRDKRFKLIKHDVNKGLFQARITGVQASKGEYFAFVDSDDYISIDFYRLLVNKATETNADIVIADFADKYEDGRLEYYNFDNVRFRDVNLVGEEVYDTFMRQHGSWFGWHTIWNKLYKRTIWDQSISYLQDFSDKCGRLVMTEDIAFSSVLWRYANKVVNVHNALLFYYHHPQQSVRNNNFAKFANNVQDVASVFDFMKSFLIKENLYSKYEADYADFLDLYIEFWTGNIDALPEADRRKAKVLMNKLFGKTVDFNYKNHYHYTKRSSLQTFYWFENIKKDICSEEIKTVSFDIFDTLVLRPFFKPSDIFYLLNGDFNSLLNGTAYVDFHKYRTAAEEHLRKESNYSKEVSLDEIYNYIGTVFGLTAEQTAVIKKKEIALEIQFAQVRKTGKELYGLAKHLGKRIIFVSDIYLDKDTVMAILNKLGYEPDEIYLSSDYLEQKATGRLYPIVLLNENLKGNQIVHIGDNWDSDMTFAQKHGFRTHFMPAPIVQLKNENRGIFTGASFYKIFGVSGKPYMGESALSFLGIRCMLAMVANKIFDNPYLTPFHETHDFNANPYFIGYYALGMHLMAVTRWLKSIALKEQRETIHFVSRDGYLPMKAFEILKKYESINTQSNYLYISRKATAPFQNTCPADLVSYIGSFSTFTSVSAETICNTYVSLTNENMLESLNKSYVLKDKCGNKYSRFNSFLGFDEACKFGKYICDEYIDPVKAKQLNASAAKYFNKIIKPNDILFDLGYRANKEYILSSLIKRPVDCLYIYTNESTAMERAISKNFSLRTFYDYTPSLLAAAREILFSEVSPSCIGYDYNSMQPIFEKEYKEHYFNEFVIKTIQEGALDFIEDFMRTFSSTIVPDLYRGFDASLPFEYFLHYAPKSDREVLGCVTFEDDLYACKSFSLMDDWEKAIGYHKLYDNKEYIALPSPPVSGLVVSNDSFMLKVISYINKKYPVGSRKRERLKKLLKLFVK